MTARPDRPARPERERDSDQVLPDITSDERDRGWGEEDDSRRDADWYRRERPPHHE